MIYAERIFQPLHLLSEDKKIDHWSFRTKQKNVKTALYKETFLGRRRLIKVCFVGLHSTSVLIFHNQLSYGSFVFILFFILFFVCDRFRDRSVGSGDNLVVKTDTAKAVQPTEADLLPCCTQMQHNDIILDSDSGKPCRWWMNGPMQQIHAHAARSNTEKFMKTHIWTH